MVYLDGIYFLNNNYMKRKELKAFQPQLLHKILEEVALDQHNQINLMILLDLIINQMLMNKKHYYL